MQSAGLWLVYAFLLTLTGFSFFLLKISFHSSVDITPLDFIGNVLSLITSVIAKAVRPVTIRFIMLTDSHAASLLGVTKI